MQSGRSRGWESNGGGHADEVICMIDLPDLARRSPSATTSSPPWLSAHTAAVGGALGSPKMQFLSYGISRISELWHSASRGFLSSALANKRRVSGENREGRPFESARAPATAVPAAIIDAPRPRTAAGRARQARKGRSMNFQERLAAAIDARIRTPACGPVSGVAKKYRPNTRKGQCHR